MLTTRPSVKLSNPCGFDKASCSGMRTGVDLFDMGQVTVVFS